MMVHHPELRDGIRGVFEMVITGTWTAFEVLAGDLWLAAVNASPSMLGTLRGSPKRIEEVTCGEPPSKDRGDGASDKTISLREIHDVTRGKFDLSNHMGDLLIQSKRVSFASLKTIREAYSMAFSLRAMSTKPHAVDVALSDLSFNALAQVRNLIVHKAGICDAEYHKNSKGTKAPPLALGAPLILDGKMVIDLVEPVIEKCVELLKAVDDCVGSTAKGR